MHRRPGLVGEHRVVEDDLPGHVGPGQADRPAVADAGRPQAEALEPAAFESVEVQRRAVAAADLRTREHGQAVDARVPQADHPELPGTGRPHPGEVEVVADPDAAAVEPGDPAAGQVEPREPGPARADRVHEHAAGQRETHARLGVIQVQRPGDPGAFDADAPRVHRTAQAQQQLAQHHGPHRGVGHQSEAATGRVDQFSFRSGQFVDNGQRREVGHQPGGRRASSSRSA
ncbi:hypothetical protein [Amycolatopsis sp. NBC_00438]|uniref:hypothetical protein n=1 Tax=Amycolatopsis sp. NBC_00438 TaxID=2903558 RepID=UPI002E23E484